MTSRYFLLPMVMILTTRAPADPDRATPLPAGPVAASWAILHEGMGDSGENHRRQAVLAAAVIGPRPQALKLIGGALRDKSTIVRQTAVAALGEMNAPETIPYLKQALDDTGDVRFTAAKALTDLGNDDGRGFLEDVLTGERKDKPTLLERNLKYAKKKLTPAELAMMGTREAAGVLLGPASLGIVVAEEVIKGSRPEKNEISGRAIAAVELSKPPDNYTRTLLEWALADSDGGVRAAAAEGLARCGSDQSIPKLQPLLADPHAAVRYMAAAAIIRLSAVE